MLGEKLDYLILRTMAHSRHRATEEELDAQGCSSLFDDQACTKLPDVLARFGGHFPIKPELLYLDMGCGSGELTLGLAKMGLKRLVGVDFLPRFIELAKANARSMQVDADVQFICADLRTWEPERKFDVLISFDALEHIAQPQAFLARMGHFLAPGGVAVLSFGPMLHSPFGDHMDEFFKFKLPWRGALFNEQAMLRVRREFYRPTDPGTRYCDIAGGLNGMRYSDFLRFARESGWRFRFLRANHLRNHPILSAIAGGSARIPLLQDFVVHNVFVVMEQVAAATGAPVPPAREAEPRQERLAA